MPEAEPQTGFLHQEGHCPYVSQLLLHQHLHMFCFCIIWVVYCSSKHLWSPVFLWVFVAYHQTSNIRRTLVGNKIVDHSGVVGSFEHCIHLHSGLNTRARFLSLALSKLRLCSVNHRAGYFSNLACDWLSIVWAYSEQETEENGPWCCRHTATRRIWVSSHNNNNSKRTSRNNWVSQTDLIQGYHKDHIYVARAFSSVKHRK